MKSDANEIKSMVREKYAEAAERSRPANASSCCGSTCGCGPTDLSIMADNYIQIEGYVPEADLGLGCGIPTEAADIQPGATVLDLGSGAGNDVFIARRIVGAAGRVIGVDMTEAMIAKANENNRKLGFTNVEFRLGEIENLPVASATVDVVVSNCVLNLVPDKRAAFAEMFRVLKPGGHFAVSDIVTGAALPDPLLHAAALYAGCVAGALPKDEYLRLLGEAGFQNVEVRKTKRIDVPEEIIREYMNADEFKVYQSSNIVIESVTVYGKRPEHK